MKSQSRAALELDHRITGIWLEKTVQRLLRGGVVGPFDGAVKNRIDDSRVEDRNDFTSVVHRRSLGNSP